MVKLVEDQLEVNVEDDRSFRKQKYLSRTPRGPLEDLSWTLIGQLDDARSGDKLQPLRGLVEL